METDFYKQASEAAKRELLELLEQQAETEKRIARLRQTILSLDTLIVDESDDEFDPMQEGLPTVGITDACRNALKVAHHPLTPVEVRNWLVGSGYDLSEQANALASIHTVLKRLVESEEAEEAEKDGKKAYQWKQKSNWGLVLAGAAMLSAITSQHGEQEAKAPKAVHYRRSGKGKGVTKNTTNFDAAYEQAKDKLVSEVVGEKDKEEKPTGVDPKVAKEWLDRMDEAASIGKTKMEQDILRNIERKRINREVWEKNHPEKKK